MDRFLDRLDDPLRHFDPSDGRNIRPDCAAVDADFHRRWLRDLVVSDVPGLPAKTLQASDCGQIRRRTGGRPTVACPKYRVRKERNLSHFFKLTAALILLSLTVFGQSSGKTRTYFIAADEVKWDYAPGGVNKMMGMKFEGYSKTFVEKGPHRIGTVYRKAIYREYTDSTFSQLKTRPAEWETAGILGPIIRAEVGDTIKILFKNNATRPYSMHPHGVFYDKASEGAPYEDGTSGADKEDDAVPPGKTHTYVWNVPERAGPVPNDPSSVVWLYHSHKNELKDVER